MTDSEWVQLPGMLGHDEFLHLMHHFDEQGVVSRHRAIQTHVGVEGGQHAYVIQVQPSDAQKVARTLAHEWEVQDPQRIEPFTGECAACGAQVEGVWECAECGISFRPRLRDDDPVVVFIREHGGFR
ncbi:MAG: hypothetical protein ACYTCU_03980 [Planctomycetota bacterium]|jgi:hypothetical protein